MELLQGWYPGYGEVETIHRMDPFTQRFLSDAISEDPDFLNDYVIPTIQGYEDPEEKILSDLSDAVLAYELSDAGLGSYDANLGNLGKSFFKKVLKTIKKVATAPAKFMKREVKKEVKAVEKVARKVGKVVDKAWQKYGNIFIQVLGAVLAPFTGGASLAAAALITAGNTLYQKKRAAQHAKQVNAANAAAIHADAAAADADTLRQVNAFYSQNQQWFITNLGVTPDKWAQLTLQQKIDLIKAGATGRPPSGTPSEPPALIPPGQSAVPGAGSAPQGGSYAPGGGGYAPAGGGDAGGSYMPSGGGAGQPGQPSGPTVQEAGMFGGAALPILAAGVALAFVFGKPVKGGGRRTRRNPRRRSRRAVA